MGSKIGLFACVTSALILAGCSANHNTAFRNAKIPDTPSAVVVDAKQRMVLSAYALLKPDGTPDNKSVRRFCSEPSPDVFSVVAQALSAGGSFGKTADPATLEAALSLAFSSAEQGSTIPRTQTTNMLREMMFRTCERFLSGGYDETELSLQAARDQRIMVSILAIEQLTGAVTPKPVVIAASASGSAGASGEAIVRLDDARKARDTAQASYQAALSAYEAENGDAKVCDAIDGKTEDELTDDQKPKKAPCDEKRKTRDEKKANFANKNATYLELSRLAAGGGVTVDTTTKDSAPGGLDRARADAIEKVASTVQTIVSLNFNDETETLLFCNRTIRTLMTKGTPSNSEKKIFDECVRFMQSYVEKKKVQLDLQTQALVEKLGQPLTLTSNEAGEAQLEEEATINAQFEIFWLREQGNFSDPAKRTDLVNRVVAKLSRPERQYQPCFATAQTAQNFRDCFGLLLNSTRRTLALGR